MLEVLISNKTRVKLLLKFFINPENRAYLRELGREFDESSNSVRIELNRFEEAGLILSEKSGNRIYYSANIRYPLYGELQQIAMKHFGLDTVLEKVVNKLGDVKKVYLLGKLARGMDSQIIDIAIVAEAIDREYLANLIEKAEKIIERKIRSLVYSNSDQQQIPEPKVIIYER